jgi:hypothetical protein
LVFASPVDGINRYVLVVDRYIFRQTLDMLIKNAPIIALFIRQRSTPSIPSHQLLWQCFWVSRLTACSMHLDARYI